MSFETFLISSSLPALPVSDEAPVPSGLPSGFVTSSKPLRQVSIVNGGGWAALQERQNLEQYQQSDSLVQRSQSSHRPYQPYHVPPPSDQSYHVPPPPPPPLDQSYHVPPPPPPPDQSYHVPPPPVPPVRPVPPIPPRASQYHESPPLRHEYAQSDIRRREEFLRSKRQLEEFHYQRRLEQDARDRRNMDRDRDRDREHRQSHRSDREWRSRSGSRSPSRSREQGSLHSSIRRRRSPSKEQSIRPSKTKPRSASKERASHHRDESDRINQRGRENGKQNALEPDRKAPAGVPTSSAGKHSIWDGPVRKDVYRNKFEAHKLPYHPQFEQCELVQEDPIVIEKDLDEVCESRDEPVSLVKLEPVVFEDPWADDNLSEGSSESDVEQSESSGDNSDENNEEREAIRQAKNEVIHKKQVQKIQREAARQTRMLAWEPVLSQQEKDRVNERTLSDCLQVACLADLADEGMTVSRVYWLRTISVHQRVRGYRQKNQRAKRTSKRPTGPRTQKPQSEKDLIKAEVADLFAVCKSEVPPALAMAKLRVGDDLDGETALLVPDTVPFAEETEATDNTVEQEDEIVQNL